MLNAIKACCRRLVAIHDPLQLPAGISESKLDLLAGKIGIGEIDGAFQSNQSVAGIADCLAVFFNGTEPTRAQLTLKKALHIVLEERMRLIALRVDPPTRYGFEDELNLCVRPHPFDAVAAQVLAKNAPKDAHIPNLKTSNRPRLVLNFIAHTLAYNATALWTLLAYGQRERPIQEYRVGAPSRIRNGDWTPLLQAARDESLAPENALLIVYERRIDQGTTPHPSARIDTMHVHFKRWAQEAVLSGLRLSWHLIVSICSGYRDPWTLQSAYEAIVIARQSLPMRRWSHNYRFEFYFDNEEYTQRHAVKAATLEAYGSKLLRWPHVSIDVSGCALSYLGYHVFCDGGPYLHRHLGASWAPSCKAVSVGMTHNDHRIANDGQVADTYRDLVSTHFAAGGKLLAYFPPSAIAGRRPLIAATTEAILRQLAKRDQWLLVIKPKAGHDFPQIKKLLDTYAAKLAKRDQTRAALVEYSASNKEVCPAGWLLEKMTLGVGMSSIRLEGVAKSKIVLNCYPILQDTPFNTHAKADGWAFENIEDFEAGLGRWLDGGPNTELPLTWYKENFDPYGDDESLARLAHLLFDADQTQPTA